MSVEYSRFAWATTTQDPGYTCSFSPKLAESQYPPTQTAVVLSGDDWQLIAIRYSLSLQKLLQLNYILLSEYASTSDLPALVPNTYVIVARAPTLAPECICPGAYATISDDESSCTDMVSQASFPRLLSTAHVASYVTSGIAAAYWAPNATTSSTSDLFINLKVTDEIFEVDLSFTRTSNLPFQVQVSALLTPSPLPSLYLNRTQISSIPDSSWTPIVTFINTAAAQTVPCTLPSSQCVQLTRGFSAGVLPLQSDGSATMITSVLRLRFLLNSTDTRPIQVESIQVSGRNDCNGHASTCWLNSATSTARVCQCQHFTMGDRCEQCQPLYNNKPWSRGTLTAANPCVLCQCNNHSSSCIYNTTVDQYPGSATLGGGGVCQQCTGHTTGTQCDQCVSQFYHPDGSLLTDDCTSCNCNPNGQVGNDCVKISSGALTAGQCYCKRNVIGFKCDTCAPSFFNLTNTNIDGCQSCACDPYGSTSANCTEPLGQCSCKNGTMGIKCNICKPGMWDLRASNPDGCRVCFQGESPNTYMYSDINNNCLYCDTECLQCTAAGPTSCKACRHYNYSGTCVATCPALFYPDINNDCQPCNTECTLGCTGPQPDQCTACKHFVIDLITDNTTSIDTCVPNCPLMYFSDSLTHRCLQCNTLCSGGCTGPLATQCQTCRYVIYGQTCLNSCPPGTYTDATNTCRPCHLQCRDTCSGPLSSDCDACLNFNNTVTAQCVAQCPTYMYSEDTNCYSCNSECLSGCYGGSNAQCSVSCTINGCLPTCKHALIVSQTANTCVAQCNNLTSFLDPQSRICQYCDSECSNGCTASGPSACHACLHYSYSGTCYRQCPVGTYPDNNTRTCIDCNSECVRGCTGPTSSECNVCAHVNNSGTCQYSCPTFTYLEGNNCLGCSQECSTGCFGPNSNQCLNSACKRFSVGDTCVSACPAGTITQGGSVCYHCPVGNYYLNSATGNCSLCNQECTGGCYGASASECIGPCKNVLLVQSNNNNNNNSSNSNNNGTGVCLSSCPSMYFAGYDRQCHQCSSLCAQGCTGSTPADCVACASHKYFNQCVATCPIGYYPSGVDCALCHPECITCTAGGPTFCPQCKNVRDPILGCVASCAVNKWPVIGATETVCTLCNNVTGMVLNNNVCQNSCPINKYIDANSVCQQCDPMCADGVACTGAGPAACSVCRYARLNGVCVATCPNSTYLDSFGVCQPCNSECVASSGCVGPSSSDCVECSTYRYPISAPLGPACRSGQTCARCVTECPGVLTHGTCALSCSPFEYISPNHTCMPCNSLCAVGCVAEGPSACLNGTCRGPKLINGQCVDACPSMQVAINGVCVACDPQCATGCTGTGPAACANGLCVAARRQGVCVSRCPASEYWVNTSTNTCQLCEPGYYCADGIQHTPCTSTTYQANTGSTTCILCPLNSACVMDLHTGLYTSYSCLPGYVNALNGTPCGAYAWGPAPSTLASTGTVDDNQITVAVSATVTVATVVIVVLAIFAIVRMRQHHSQRVIVSHDSLSEISHHRNAPLFDEPVFMNTLNVGPASTGAMNYHQHPGSVSQNETYM